MLKRCCILLLVMAHSVPALAEEDWRVNAELFRAARAGDAKAIKWALDDGADVNAKTPDGSNALVLASGTGKMEAVKALLEAGASGINETYPLGKLRATPLSVAAWSASPAVVDLLLKHGADPKSNHYDALRGAIVSASKDSMEALLAAGADVNCRFKDGQSPLTVAAIRGHSELAALFIDKGAKVDFRDDAGDTALMFAASQGHEATAALLLKHNASTSLFDVDGRTALSVASQVAGPEVKARIEKLLLAAGAKKEATAREIDQQYLLAAHQGDAAKVKALLDKGAELEARGKPNINLWLRDALSASVAHPQVCKLLLERGINPRMRDGGGFTALHAAASDGSAACIEALAAAGLDPNDRAKHGQTPLYMSINARRPPAIVNALLRAGADPNGPGGDPSLIAAAKRRGLGEVEKLLREAGGQE